jgi:spermidine synthase
MLALMSSKVREILSYPRSFIRPVEIASFSSEYAPNIRVVRDFGRLLLYIDNALQSGWLLLPVWKKVFRFFGLTEEKKLIQKALVIGVGGGDAIQVLKENYPKSQITAVDIDPIIFFLARKYFKLNSVNHPQEVVSDARLFVRKAISRKLKYDLIIIDIYQGQNCPEWLVRGKFLSEIKNLLAEKGKVLFNYSLRDNQSKQAQFMLDKLRKNYQSVNKYDIDSYRFYCLSGLINPAFACPDPQSDYSD